ncbi:hypothetical protein SAMN06265360_102218 [Haloechinothrix alba]|uniref:Uncharacterized protein n=1 Tax=Haloechinothrix alba TaxID=664784 RepID=A0A238VGB2_9PSEU|nr:hypothetical protein SAMN06265360_102218 [Haloechinothrix alba]
MVERRGDHPDDGHLRDPAPAHPRCGDALFQHLDGVSHRGVMRLRNQRLRTCVRDAPDRADRLRWRERQVEPGDGRARGLGKLFLADALHGLLPLLAPQLGAQPCNPCCNPLAWWLQLREPGAESFAGDGVDAVAQQPGQVFLGHRVALGQCWGTPLSEARQAGADPCTGRAARLGVIPGQRAAHLPVAVTDDDRVQQVLVTLAGRHHPDRHHHDGPSPRRAQERPSQGSGERSAPERGTLVPDVWRKLSSLQQRSSD